MRPARISLRSVFPPACPHWWRILSLLLAITAIGVMPSGAATTLTCSSCGLEGHSAINCPLRRSREALAPGETLSDIIARARREHARLRSIRGLSVPALGTMTTQAELESELRILIEATQSEITRCERDAADYQQRGLSAGAESAALSRLVDELVANIAQTRTHVAETETLTAAEIRAASATRDEILQLQETLNAIRQEIRNVRNRLFPRLHQAARAGWIHPPSSYRSMPRALEPKRQREDNASGAAKVDTLAADRSTATIERINSTAPDRAVRIGSDPDPDLQLLLERLSALGEKARTAAARRDEAIRSLERHLTEKDQQSARLSALQPERVTVTNHLTAARRNLTIARQTHEEYTARLATTRGAAVHSWIEWGLFQLQEKKAAALLAGAGNKPGESSFLEAWRDVAEVSVQLGSDPLDVIATFPAKAAARGESLDELRRDLAGGREKFRLSFLTTDVSLPATALPYVVKGSP
jgi:chromosome segregation ATPase